MGMSQVDMIDSRKGIIDSQNQAQDGTNDAPHEEQWIL
jgi:hypothetical protein